MSYSTLVLSYGEALASATLAAADFAVLKNGTTAVAVTGVAVNTVNDTVTLTLASAVSDTDTVQVSYTAGASKTQDLAGNAAANLVDLAVTNATPSSDTTPPAAPSLALLAASDSGASSGDRITSDDTPTVRVTLNGSGATAPVAGDIVNLYSGATQIGTATLSAGDIAAGYVDVTTSTLGADGAKSLTATATDVASNASGASGALAITLDTTVPALSSATVNGATLVLTYDETLGGATPAAGDFSVSVNGSAAAPSGVVVDAAARTLTLTLSSAAANGDAVSVSYIPGSGATQDVAGNAAVSLSAQAVSNLTPDTTAPAAPSLALLASSDSGESTADRVTSDGTPTIRVALNGSGATAPAAGDVVKLYSGAAQVGTATLGAGDIASGYVDITTAALGADGAKSLTATLTDASNNTSAASSVLALTLDTAAPALNSASVNGASLVLAYGETLGAAPPAAGDFAVTVNGVPVAASAVAVDTAAKTVTLTLVSPAGVGDAVTVSYTPGASQTQDVAGNAAAALAGQAVNNVTGDTTPPTVASIDDGDADNVVEPGDVLSYTVTFSEDIDASTVTGADFGNAGTAGVTVGAVAKTAPGVFSVQVTATSVGTLVLQVNAGALITDAAGNALDTTSAILDDTTVIVADLTAPAAPGLTLLAASDSGQSSADRLTNIDTPTLRVALNGSGRTAPVAGDTVTLYSGAAQVGTALLASGDIANGYIDVTTSALGVDGAKGLTATIIDAAGNASAPSAAVSLTLDTVAPVLASATVDGATLVLTYGETLAGTTPAAGDFSAAVNGVASAPGGVALDPVAKTVMLTLSAPVANGDAVTVSYAPGGSPTQDAAGNAAAALGAHAVVNATPDTTAPAAPALALLAASDSGASSADRLTDIDTPTLRVTLNGVGAAAAVAGDVVKVYSGATQVGTATLSAGDIANSYIDVTTAALGADGTKSLTATVTDAAGNIGAPSAALAIVLDTRAPALVSASVDAATLVLTYDETLAGAAPAAADFAVTLNGAPMAPSAIVVDAVAKTITLTLAAPAVNGDVVAVSYVPGASRTQDAAGNTAAALGAQAVMNATPAPVPPAPALPAPAASAPVSGTVIPIGRLGDSPAAATLVRVEAPVAQSADVAPAAPSRLSLVGIGAELDPLRPAQSDRPGDSGRAARAFELKLVDNTLTLPGERAFRIAVSRADAAALMVFHGIPDQELSPDSAVSFRVPADAFVHTRASAIITLRATLADGRPLPRWLRFDASTGKFDGEPPAGAARVLSVLVTARDGDGREASTMFRIRFDAATRRDPGRAGLSEQLRRVADGGLKLERALDPARRVRVD